MRLDAKVYDLAQPYYPGMPHYPTHPPFLFGLTKKHGEVLFKDGASSAAESIALGGHVGTHIDALNHFSCGGVLFGGRRAEDVQSYTEGVNHLSVDTIPPILRRGVLIDVAGEQGVDVLPIDFAISVRHLEAAARAEVRAGDVVLIRTGWAQYYSDAARYVAEAKGPGPELEAAQWLSERGVFAAGSDTIAFEKVPNPAMPVHVHLIVKSGIHIIEVLQLEELARERVYEFTFVAAPLKIRGGTGAPVRPLAIVD